MANQIDRRGFLSVAGGIVAAISGCAESDNGGNGSVPETATATIGEPEADGGGTVDESGTATNTTDSEMAPGQTANETQSASETTEGGADLDLREANVVGVAFDRQDGTVQFDVTLYHDDDGEAKYANWWQVETLDGHRLGRRKLLHAHSTAPFTRSETVDVPAGTDCVVVRGHDQIHDYGGQAALVNVESGETSLIRQGGDRQSFDAAECP